MTRWTLMPWRAKNSSARAKKRGGGGGFLVGEHFGVGKPGGVVDSDVHVVPSDDAAVHAVAVAPTVGLGFSAGRR